MSTLFTFEPLVEALRRVPRLRSERTASSRPILTAWDESLPRKWGWEASRSLIDPCPVLLHNQLRCQRPGPPCHCPPPFPHLSLCRGLRPCLRHSPCARLPTLPSCLVSAAWVCLCVATFRNFLFSRACNWSDGSLVSKTELLNRPRATSKRIRSLCTQHQHFALARTFASAHKPSNCQGSAAAKEVSSLRTLVLQFPRSPVASPSWLWLAGSVPSCLALPGYLARPNSRPGSRFHARPVPSVSFRFRTRPSGSTPVRRRTYVPVSSVYRRFGLGTGGFRTQKVSG